MARGDESGDVRDVRQQQRADINAGLRKKRNVVYTAKIWRLIMFVIRSIPEPIFKKMSI